MTNTKHWHALCSAWALSFLCSHSACGAPLTNMVIASDGGRRFTGPDQGSPILYVVDADAYPDSFTTNQLLSAVSNAFAAWSDATYLRFQFGGIQSFGKPVKLVALDSLNKPAGTTLQNSDKRIWIQLHNLHTNLANPDQLGLGDSRVYVSERVAGAQWFKGGRVAGNDFYDIKTAWVAINHTNSELTSFSTLEEVLCHNIGLALGMETNANENSIMYYQTHADGRGAQLGAIDVNVIQQAYPSNNPVPYTFDRSLEIVTTPTNQPALNIHGINQLQLRGYDLLTTNLTLSVSNGNTNLGAFSNQLDIVSYTPNGFHEITNIASEYLYFRYSDGVNQSPYGTIVVRSLRQDSFPAGAADGVPDYFMNNFFGNPDPSAGANRGAGDDFDGDGLTTLEEYISGMNPIAGSSAQRITLLPNGLIEWQAKPDELYEVQSATSVDHWSSIQPVLATNSTASVTVGPKTNTQQFYRVVKIR